MSPYSYQYSQQQGFTPSSQESMRAVQMEHRYEGRASAQQQAACIHPVGRRNLAHAYQVEMNARNDKSIRRQLAGRRTAAALEWLLKRQQERQQTEQAAYKPGRRGAGALAHSRTSPNNPLCIQQEPTPAVPTPAEMVAALAALDTSPAPAAASTTPTGSAARPQQQQQQQTGSRPGSPSMGVQPVACTCPAQDSSTHCSCGAADKLNPELMTILQAADDAVAVITDGVAAHESLVPAHMAGHMALGSMSPEPDCNGPTSPTLAQQAAAAAYWKHQELEELMTALLQQYPHGIPRKMMMDLRQLGVHDAPPLGFGCTTSSECLSTLLLRNTQ